MIVHVKQEHIDKGQQKIPFNCPISLAIKDLLGIQKVSNIGNVIYNDFEKNKKRKGWKTTKSVSRFTSAFDRGKPVKPFKFRMPNLWSGKDAAEYTNETVCAHCGHREARKCK